MRVQGAGRRLLRRLGIRRGFRPDWSVPPFLEALSSRSISFEAFRRSHPELAPLECVALFFRERSSPRFFVDPGEIPALASRVETAHPSWKQRSIALVRRHCREGLDIYSRKGPVLDREFPWGAIEPGPGGDRLYRKRPHRFAFAPRLALAASYGESSVGILREVLLGWMSFAASAENALAYDSNLAVIQRVLALSWARAFLAGRGNPTPDDLTLEGLVLQVIKEDAKFLLPRLGDSPANNHLLADTFAGWFLGVVWPELAGEGLRERFEPQWLHELERQMLSDGTSFEHSTHYHEYACEMAAAYLILSRRNGLSVPEWVQERTRRALEFQAALAGPTAATLAIGDSAEDPLFPLDGGDGWATASWSELLRGLFSFHVPCAVDAPSRERAFWLLGGFPERGNVVEDKASATHAYPRGGYFVFQEPALSSLVFRTGPDPREAVAPGHMHADWMSVYASAKGMPFIVDAGTYTYRRKSQSWPSDEPDWRVYFRGPSAHNALAIEGEDPLGAAEGDFRGGLHGSVETKKALGDPVASWVDAVLDARGAYGGYRRGVIHVPGEYWIVYDVLPEPALAPGGSRTFGFQLAPGCEVEACGERGVRVRLDGATLCLTASEGLLPPRFWTGSRNPPGGWVSESYGRLVPAPQIRFGIEEGARVTAFLLLPEPDLPDDAGIDVEKADPLGLRLDVTIGDVGDTLIVNPGSRDVEVRSRGMVFRGDLAFTRVRAGRVEAVRWLNGQRLGWQERGLLVETPEIMASMSLAAGEILPHAPPAGLSIRWPEPPDPGDS